jgi:hypothetical protein
VRQFGLLNGRSRAAKLRCELSVTFVLADNLLQNVGCIVLEVAENQHVFTAFLQGFRTFAKLHRSIHQNGQRHTASLGKLLVGDGHVFAFPTRAGGQLQNTNVLMSERLTGRRQFRGPHSEDRQHLFGTDLIRVVRHHDPVVGLFDRLLDRRDPHP